MNEKNFYTAKELSEKLECNIMTIYRYIKAKKLTAYKIGKEFRVERQEYNSFIKKSLIK